MSYNEDDMNLKSECLGNNTSAYHQVRITSTRCLFIKLFKRHTHMTRFILKPSSRYRVSW